MSAIFRGPKKGYQLTDDDIEWLARSMWGEASATTGRIAVAWSHINRFLLINFKWMQVGWSFKKYIQNHSQPVNPRWNRNGYFCKPGGPYYGKPECAENLLKRRDKFQTQAVPASIMQLAQEFADGKHPSPFTEPTYDFAACSLVRKQHRPNTGIDIGGNCHLTYSSLKPGSSEIKAVVPGEVTLDTPVTSKGIGKAGIVIVSTLFLYGIYRFFSGK